MGFPAAIIRLHARDAEMRLAQVPAISTADPQAATAAKLVNWLSAGLVNVTIADIGMGASPFSLSCRSALGWS